MQEWFSIVDNSTQEHLHLILTPGNSPWMVPSTVEVSRALFEKHLINNS